MDEDRKRIRVLIAKPGLDGHDRGAHLIARALRDAGYEVIYTGLYQTIPAIVDAAIQEDVDVIGLSILSGTHLSFSRKLMNELKLRGSEDFVVIVGGTVPEGDIQSLVELGIDGVFPVGTQLTGFPERLKALVDGKRIHFNG